MDEIIVHKFGGSCLRDGNDIDRIGEIIQNSDQICSHFCGQNTQILFYFTVMAVLLELDYQLPVFEIGSERTIYCICSISRVTGSWVQCRS